MNIVKISGELILYAFHNVDFNSGMLKMLDPNGLHLMADSPVIMENSSLVPSFVNNEDGTVDVIFHSHSGVKYEFNFVPISGAINGVGIRALQITQDGKKKLYWYTEHPEHITDGARVTYEVYRWIMLHQNGVILHNFYISSWDTLVDYK